MGSFRLWWPSENLGIANLSVDPALPTIPKPPWELIEGQDLSWSASPCMLMGQRFVPLGCLGSSSQVVIDVKTPGMQLTLHAFL
jgi:hypothetical protein